jgi:hypothetical protein
MRALGTAAVMAAACLPFAVWRALHAGSAVNGIHTETQGLMWLTGSVRVVSPGVLWDWIGGMWLLFPLAWWPLWRHGRSHAALLYLLTTSVGVAIVLFTPPLVAVLEPRVGYLLMRTVWMLPSAGLAGLAALALSARMRSPALGAGARIAAIAGALLLLDALLPFARDAALTLLRPERFAAG